MGITGLLPLLKDIQRRTSVSTFSGKSVGIDAYCWLHKGVYGCAKDVVEGKKTNVYINYIMRRVNMLLNYNINPILVFDGGYLPAKASKEKERRRGREENLKKGKAFLRAGNTAQATECFQRCVEITPAMATEVIQACRKKNVMCVVAPYEADAQLAYLEMQGITQFTITEDSDLLIYGCKKVLFKMNSDGDGVLIDLDELNNVKTVALESFTMEKFRHMCILSGCDYLPSVKGLGLYKAHKFLKKSTNVYKAIQLIKGDKKLQVPDDYADNFRKTDAVFKYQSVFDPRTKTIVRVTEVSDNDNVTTEELQFAGPPLDPKKAMKIALGNIDPITGEPLANFEDFMKPTEKKKESELPCFVDYQSKPRNNDLNYVVDESANEAGEVSLEDTYLHHLEKQAESKRMLDLVKETLKHKEDDNSPPEKSLQNIKLYEKTNPSSAPSIGILYGGNKRNDSSATTLGHHSVFVKRKAHKFKNPFRSDNEEEDMIVADMRSRYFSTEADNKENHSSDINSPRKSQSQPNQCEADQKELPEETKDADSLNSPPPSKRAKFSFIKFLDSHSKTSLKREASKMSDLDSSFSSPENEAGKPRDTNRNETRKTSFINESEFGLKKEPLLPVCPELMDENESVGKEKFKKDSLMKFMFSKKSKDVDENRSKISLFKAFDNARSRFDEKTDDDLQGSKDSGISMSQNSNEDDVIEITSSYTQSQTEKSKSPTIRESILQLKSRSISEPNISSSKKPLTGRCKKIGLSKKSRSSLDRVRDSNASKLSQSKLGFQRFAYAKKKIDWNESANQD